MTARENSLPGRAFESAGLGLAQDFNVSDVRLDSLADKLSREAQLLASLPQGAQSGFLKRIENAGNWETALEVSGGAAAGAGLALAYKNPGAMWGLAGTITSVAPKALGALAVVDLGSRVAQPVLDTWNDPTSLEANKAVLGGRIGAAGFEYGTALLAGGAAAKLTSKVSGSLFGRPSYSEFAAEWKSASSMSTESPVLVDTSTIAQSRWNHGRRFRDTVYTLSDKGPGSSVASDAEVALFDAMKNSVVKIDRISGSKSGSGTGFVVRPDGLVATAYHVVKGRPGLEGLKVHTWNGRVFDAHVVARDRLADIALIKLNNVGKPLQALRTGRISDVQSGSDLYAFGHALGRPSILMSRGQYLTTETQMFPVGGRSSNSLVADIGKNVVELPLLKGMSGGPTVTSDGTVVGLSSSIVMKKGVSTSAEHLNLLLANYSNAAIPKNGVFSMRSKATFDGSESGGIVSVQGLKSRVLEPQAKLLSASPSGVKSELPLTSVAS